MPENNKQEKILQSLDGIEKIPAPDFFYTRLKARMEKEKGDEKPVFFLLRPAFLATCMVLVLILNVAVLLNRQQASPTFNKENNNAGIENFANDYNLTGASQLYQ